MKSMTCRQLGGACDMVFKADTFDEMKALSQNHGRDMFQKGDPAHLEAMNVMKTTMKSPADFERWMNDKQTEFDNSPDID